MATFLHRILARLGLCVDSDLLLYRGARSTLAPPTACFERVLLPCCRMALRATVCRLGASASPFHRSTITVVRRWLSAVPDTEDSGSTGRIVLERRAVGGGQVATITLNNPHRYNVLTGEMIEELQGHVDALGRDSRVRVIVIKGAGKQFSGGHDLKEMHNHAQRRDKNFFEVIARCVWMAVRDARVPQPVIASVQGIATGAGCQLVAACDLAIASSDARLATSGVNLGLFCSTPAVPLSRNVSRKRAFEMLVTGDFIDAKTAQDWGLINKVVPSEVLDEAVNELVDTIMSKPTPAIAIGKRLFYLQLEKMNLLEAYQLAAEAMARNVFEDETEERIAAFVEKRQPAS